MAGQERDDYHRHPDEIEEGQYWVFDERKMQTAIHYVDESEAVYERKNKKQGCFKKCGHCCYGNK
jgi:hypothetical protein